MSAYFKKIFFNQSQIRILEKLRDMLLPKLISGEVRMEISKMEMNQGLKLFISYSHEDEEYRKKFLKHISPLKRNGLIFEWHDRKIIAGSEFQDKIDHHLEDADIVCLFISANFLNSPACMEEKRKALELRKQKGIAVIAIILSECGWLDDRELSPLLALPTDGKPIARFTPQDGGWKDVYDGLKLAIEQMLKIKKFKISGSFLTFLNSTEMLAKAHSQKTEVLLDDIFVYPELTKYELKEYEKTVRATILIEDFIDYPKVLIAGEGQSGKTTLCKKLYVELGKKNFFPVYISDKNDQYKGHIENKIAKAFKKQYESVSLEEIDKKRIVPILDDFHRAKKKEKIIRELSTYSYQILIVDDIFSLSFKDESLTKSFSQYRVKQLSPTLRNELIEKWIHLSDKAIDSNQNVVYKGIDSATELVNSTLGKIISRGIMPAYPFFILSIISTYETFEKPLDQEITSQGYCYQAFIYLYLRKQGVKNDDIDTYINFLSVLAYYFFSEKKQELSVDEFNLFLSGYVDKYNLPVEEEVLLSKLQETKILFRDSFNNYQFYYPYLYYFFAAKYLAEHLSEDKNIIEEIINNLHKDENAYITIFISHHSKNFYILDEISRNALCLFDKHEPATLIKGELSFFDDKLEVTVHEFFLSLDKIFCNPIMVI